MSPKWGILIYTVSTLIQGLFADLGYIFSSLMK